MGSWYFLLCKDYDFDIDRFAFSYWTSFDSSCDGFSVQPDDIPMNELLGAAARARREMPALQEMSLTSGSGGTFGPTFTATWIKAKTRHYFDRRLEVQPVTVGNDVFLAGDHVYWYTGTTGRWRPTSEVEEAWVGSGNQRWFGGYLFGQEGEGFEGPVFPHKIVDIPAWSDAEWFSYFWMQ